MNSQPKIESTEKSTHDFTRLFWGNNILNFWPIDDNHASMCGVGPIGKRMRTGDFLIYKHSDTGFTKVVITGIKYTGNPPDYFEAGVELVEESETYEQ